MQYFKFVNWRIGEFVFWCHEQVSYSILIGHTASRDLAYWKNATRLDLIQTPHYYGAQCGASTSTLTQNSSQAAAFFRFGTETKNIEHHHVARRRQKWVEIDSDVAFWFSYSCRFLLLGFSRKLLCCNRIKIDYCVPVEHRGMKIIKCFFRTDFNPLHWNVATS